MANQRQIDIYSAGCALCEKTVAMVRGMVCPSCAVAVHDMTDPAVASAAKDLGITAVPAVVIDGRLAACCTSGGPDAETLKAAGIGRPL